MQELRANTQIVVTIGPFVDVGDGFTPEVGITLGAADEAELVKHGATTGIDISARTWAVLNTVVDAYYNLTLTTTDTNTEGMLLVVIQDDSVCLPVKAEFMVLSEAAWDSKYVAKDSGFMDVNIKHLGDAELSTTHLKDFADTGYDPTTHRARANLEEILGHLLTQTGTQVADGFEHFFDHATPAITVGDAMRGTNSAALASVLGALNDAAAAGDPTDADTLIQYLKQLINILIGTAGIGTFPAEAAPGNAVSLAEVIRAIHVDVTGLNGDAMVGTNGANTTVPDAAGVAATPAEVATALTNIHLDHLLAANYDPASKPGVATALLNELVENDTGVSRFTENALEQGPSGTGASAATIADAVWDEAQSEHVTAGKFGVIASEVASILEDTGTAGVPLVANAVNASTLSYTAVDEIAGMFGDDIWYVSKSGHDGNTGLSWGQAFLTIGKAVTEASAGGMIRIGSGTFDEAVNSSGLGGLHFIGSGPERTIISNSGITLTVASATTIEDLSATSTNTGIYTNGGNNITIRRCFISGGNDGLYAKTSDNLIIEDCWITSIIDACQVSQCQGLLMRHCAISTPGATHFGSTALLTEGADGVIESCVIQAVKTAGSDSNMTAVGAGDHDGSSRRNTLHLLNCSIICTTNRTGASSKIYGVKFVGHSSWNGICKITGGSIFTLHEGDGTAYDLGQSIAGILQVSGLLYDTAKTTGTIIDKATDDVTTDAASRTASQADVSGLATTGADGDTLKTLSDQIDTIEGGTGSGARTVAVTVNDGTDALENANVRFTEGGNTYVGPTNASGFISFSLDDATYDPLAISKPGYSFTPTTLVVDGDKTVTYSMTAVSISAPPSASTTTGVMTVYDEEMSVEGSVEISVQITDGPGTDGIGYDSAVWTETSSALGVVEFAGIVKGATYKIWRGDSKPNAQTFTAPTSGDSFDLAEVIGRG